MDNDKIKEEIWFYLVSFDILSLILQKNKDIKSKTMKKLLPDNTGLENNEIKNVSLPNVYNLSLLSKNMYELFSQNNDLWRKLFQFFYLNDYSNFIDKNIIQWKEQYKYHKIGNIMVFGSNNSGQLGMKGLYD